MRQALAGRIVVCRYRRGREDEHRGPTRFMGQLAAAWGRRRQLGRSLRAAARADPAGRAGNVPGALLQIAAIQAAASGRPASLAARWLRFSAAAMLALVFAAFALGRERPGDR